MDATVAHIDPYTLGDSAAGIILAAEQGHMGTDLNIRTCRANTWRPWRRKRRAVLMHWAEWWKHGYEPIPGHHVPRKPVEQLTLRQVQSLRSIHGHHRVLTVEQALVVCKTHGIIPCFELKPSLWPAQVLQALHAAAVRYGWPVVVMTIQAYGKTARARARWENQAHARMLTAHDAGLITMLLYRRPVDWTKWAPILDAIKGHAGHDHVVDVHALLRQLHAGLHH